MNNVNEVKKYLTVSPPPIVESESFWGRDEELFQLRNHFHNRKQYNQNVILEGKSGIGKSSIAIQYFKNSKDSYDHLAWVNCEFGVLHGIKGSGFFEITGNSSQLDIEDPIKSLKIELSKLSGKSVLLIFDNADNPDEIRKVFPIENEDVDIILTTKTNSQIPSLKRISIHPLDKTSRKSFFYSQIGDEEVSDNWAERLFKIVDFNTYLIKVLAQAFKRDSETSLEVFVKNMSGVRIGKIPGSKKLQVTYRGNKTGFLQDLIIDSFHSSGISNEASKVLTILAAIGGNHFLGELSVEVSNILDLNIKDSIYELDEAGWLSYDESSNQVRFHGLLNTAISKNQICINSINNELYIIIDWFLKILDKEPSSSEFKPIFFSAIKLVYYLSEKEHYAEKLGSVGVSVLMAANSIKWPLIDSNFYDILEENLRDRNDYIHLGLYYLEKGKLELIFLRIPESIRLLTQAINIFENFEFDGDDVEDRKGNNQRLMNLASAYVERAMAFEQIGNPEKRRFDFKKAQESTEKALKLVDDLPTRARMYNSVRNISFTRKQLNSSPLEKEKELKDWLMSLRYVENESQDLAKNEPYLVWTHSDIFSVLSIVSFIKNNFSEAKKYYDQSIRLLELVKIELPFDKNVEEERIINEIRFVKNIAEHKVEEGEVFIENFFARIDGLFDNNEFIFPNSIELLIDYSNTVSYYYLNKKDLRKYTEVLKKFPSQILDNIQISSLQFHKTITLNRVHRSILMIEENTKEEFENEIEFLKTRIIKIIEHSASPYQDCLFMCKVWEKACSNYFEVNHESKSLKLLCLAKTIDYVLQSLEGHSVEEESYLLSKYQSLTILAMGYLINREFELFKSESMLLLSLLESGILKYSQNNEIKHRYVMSLFNMYRNSYRKNGELEELNKFKSEYRRVLGSWSSDRSQPYVIQIENLIENHN